MGFHAALTVYALRQGQPDLKRPAPIVRRADILGKRALRGATAGDLFPNTVSWGSIFPDQRPGNLTAFEHYGRGSFRAKIIPWK